MAITKEERKTLLDQFKRKRPRILKSRLTEKQYAVLGARHGRKTQSYGQIAADLKVTRTRVRQIEIRAIRRLLGNAA